MKKGTKDASRYIPAKAETLDDRISTKLDNRVERQVERMAGYGLTNKEIAEVLGYDENTLKRHFEIFLTKGRVNLKERLKRKQIAVALQGNVTMLIWLGKQYLEQKEQSQDLNEIKILLERKDISTTLNDPQRKLNE
jgi:DNA-binding CsgD family transcriptional regulator